MFSITGSKFERSFSRLFAEIARRGGAVITKDHRLQLVAMLAEENRFGFIEFEYSGLDNFGVVLSVRPEREWHIANLVLGDKPQ